MTSEPARFVERSDAKAVLMARGVQGLPAVVVDGDLKCTWRYPTRGDLAFLGSPSLRIDGEDVDPDARTREDFAVQCRLYRTVEGVRGTPPDSWVRDLLHRHDRS